MKLFQKMLVAQAALGLIAPISANASEINFRSISDYAPTTNEFQAASELSDIHPSDWTFQALTEVRNARACNVSLPTGVITRTEAAALLNRCLHNVNQLSVAELRLIDEFAPEISSLKGISEAIDGYDFEAGQFSATTTLTGSSNMLIGAIDGERGTGAEKLKAVYGYGLDLNTSFSGEDLLYAGITQGNFDDVGGSFASMDMEETSDTLTVSSLYYSFPLSTFTVTAGPLLDQDDVVSATTSVYSDAWKLGGNPYTLPGTTGTGAAISTSLESGFNFSASLISAGATSSDGIGTKEGEDTLTAMVGYDGEGFGGGLIFTSLGEGDSGTTGYDAIGGGIYYSGNGFTISATYDTKDVETAGAEDLEAWLIGTDISVGPGTLSAAISNVPDSDSNDDDETTYEIYYSYPVSDNLTVTPGIFFEEGDAHHEDLTGFMINTSFTF